MHAHTYLYTHNFQICIYFYVYQHILKFMSSHQYLQFQFNITRFYSVFSLFILVTSIFKSKKFYSHYSQSIHLCAHSLLCSQCPDPAGPPPPLICLVDPYNLIANWTQSVGILKVYSEVAFLQRGFGFASTRRLRHNPSEIM